MDDLLELTGRAEATHFWFRGFRKFIAPVLEDVADGRAGLRLVDCGCGTGNNLRLLQPHGRTFGFDLTSSGPARARLDGWMVVRGDITRIPLVSESVDVATVTKDRTRYYRPHGRAPFDLGNASDQFLDPYRQDYAPEVPDTGIRVDPTGIAGDIHQDTDEGWRIKVEGQYLQVEFEGRQGRCETRGLVVETIRGTNREGTRA